MTVQHGTRFGLGLGRMMDLPSGTWTKGFTVLLRAMKGAGLP